MEPRFYIDHSMIHDRVTGKHVTTDEDTVFCDGINAALTLLNEMSGEVEKLREIVRAGISEALPDMAIFLLHTTDWKIAQAKLRWQAWVDIAKAAIAGEPAPFALRSSDLIEAAHQALRYIEDDEHSHGRTFGAGNALRDALAKAEGK